MERMATPHLPGPIALRPLLKTCSLPPAQRGAEAAEAEHHQQVRDGEQGFGTAMEGIDVCQQFAVAQLGNDGRPNRHGYKQEGALETLQGQLWKSSTWLAHQRKAK